MLYAVTQYVVFTFREGRELHDVYFFEFTEFFIQIVIISRDKNIQQ